MTSPQPPQAGPPPPYNPYAAPSAPREEPPEPESHLRFGATWIKWAYLALEGGSLACFALPPLGDTADAAYRIAFGIATFLWLARLGLGVVWFYIAWEKRPFPVEHRMVGGFGAILRMIVPLYGVYWIFAANIALADAVDPARGRSVRVSRADALNAKMCAMVAASLQVASVAFGKFPGASSIVFPLTVVTALAWFTTMFFWERGFVLVTRFGA